MTLKKIVGVIVLFFLIYFVVTQPNQAANFVESIWAMIKWAFTSFGTFLSDLAH